MRVLLLLLLPFSVLASECSHLPNDCEYYLCIAREKSCNDSSYPVKFGHRFCMRYQERMNTFSLEGWKWVEDVRRCLIRDMNNFEENLSCSELKQRAFQSHVPCYLESGFCSLSVRDKRAVIQAIWPATRNSEIFSAGTEILKRCYQDLTQLTSIGGSKF